MTTQPKGNHMESIPHSGIQCTTDYGIFKPHSENRLTQETRDSRCSVAALAKSMKERGYLTAFPVIVDSEMRVYDGQHRLLAAKMAGVPVYYVVNNSIKIDDVRTAGAIARKWTLLDYIGSYVRAGNPHYQRLHVITAASPFDIGIARNIWAAAYSGSKDNFSSAIKDGSFVLTAEIEAKYNELLQRLTEIQSFSPGFVQTSRAALGALSLLSHPEYDHGRMKEKLGYQSTRIVRCFSSEEYSRLLYDIYNYKALPANRIKPAHSVGGRHRSF